MSLMDSIDVQYVWKAIQESERSDEISYLDTVLSDGLFQACHSESERSGGKESRPQPKALTLRTHLTGLLAAPWTALRQSCPARRWLERFGLHLNSTR